MPVTERVLSEPSPIPSRGKPAWVTPATTGLRRRVLILNQYFPPDTSATARMADGVTAALAERFDVVVLTGRPSYDPAERHPPYLFRRSQHGRVRVERVGSTAFDRRGAVGRAANYLSYAALAFPRALAIRADIVISMTDPPFAGILGAAVAALKRSHFVYNIRDLHPDMALRSGMIRPSVLVELWDQLHRWALRRAKKIVVLGEDMRERILAKGIVAEHVTVIRDGAPFHGDESHADSRVASAVRGSFSFVAVHAGNLGFAGAWGTLVSAAAKLRSTGSGMVFIGGGASLASVRELAAGCERIRFLPFFAAAQVPQMLAAADIHVVSVRRGVEGLVVPSKIYPILAAGRPVLAVAAPASDVAQIVTRWGCGVVADPDDPDAVAQTLDQLANNPMRLKEMGLRARVAAAEYDAGAQLQRFVQLIGEV